VQNTLPNQRLAEMCGGFPVKEQGENLYFVHLSAIVD
jgi:hypothetical protein